MKKSGKIIGPLLNWTAGGVFLLALSCWCFQWPVPLPIAAEQPPIPASAQARSPAGSAGASLAASFAGVVDRIAPCVVYVYSTRTVRRPSMSDLFGDSFLRRFFGDQFSEESESPRSFTQHGLGSGVIVTEDGYILTNYHVVEGADEVKVKMANDKKEFATRVVGHDTKTDLAVLKIENSDLTFATLADSDSLKVGDVVLAVGNPFGVGQTVTMGIISATRRGGMGIEEFEDFIQTDAAINPGNSGGALVDAQGRLIGINTAILSRTGGFQGVGFAVPMNLAKNVMDQIIKTGRVVRGYLGVSIQNLTPDLAQEFDVPSGNGALVGSVTESSAAAEAGLKSGDVIVEFNGKPVEDSRQLMLLVGGMAPGSKARVKVIRDGQKKTFNVTLKQMPDEPMTPGGEAEHQPGDVLSGVTVSDLDAATRRQLDIPSDIKGAIVTRIDPGSAAYDAGLRAGNVIQEINHQDVENAAQAMSAGRKSEDKQVLLRVWSQGGSRFLVIKEGSKP